MGKPKKRPRPKPPRKLVTIGPYVVRKRSALFPKTAFTGRLVGKATKRSIVTQGKSWGSARKMVHVVPYKGDWAIKVGGKTISVRDTKAEAVDQGKDIAKSAPLGQIVIHKQDGSIQTGHTYGKDPKKYPS